MLIIKAFGAVHGIMTIMTEFVTDTTTSMSLSYYLIFHNT